MQERERIFHGQAHGPQYFKPTGIVSKMTIRDTTRYAVSAKNHATVSDFLRDSSVGGMSTINFNGSPLDILVDTVRGATTAIISFHPAVTSPKVTRPYFVGASVLSSITAHRIYLSDPSLELNDEIALAWFAGNGRQPDMRQVIQKVIAHVLECLNSPHVVFYGASGGGFAALNYASSFSGSLAIAMNPQTDIFRYYDYHILRYTKPAWNIHSVEKAKKLLPSQITTNILDLYAHDPRNSVLYLQNSRDDHHIIQHMRPLLGAIAHPDSFRFLMGNDWGDGHSPAPKDLQVRILEAASVSNGDWESLYATIPDLQTYQEVLDTNLASS